MIEKKKKEEEWKDGVKEGPRKDRTERRGEDKRSKYFGGHRSHLPPLLTGAKDLPLRSDTGFRCFGN